MLRLVTIILLSLLLHQGNPVCTKWYKIRKWDLCGQIENENNITRDQLVNMNKECDCLELINCEAICVGKNDEPREKCVVNATIDPNLSCNDIATSYYLTLRQFLQLNPDIDCDSVPLKTNVVCVTGVYTDGKYDK